MDILGNVMCSITASIIYDIFKVIASKFNFNEETDQNYNDIIARISEIETPEEFLILEETGILEFIITTPSIEDMIYSYTLCKVGLYPKLKEIKDLAIKNEQNLVKEISKKIYQLKFKNRTVVSVNINQLEKYIEHIVSCVKKIIFDELNQSSRIEVFFVNSYISSLFEETNKELGYLKHLIKKDYGKNDNYEDNAIYNSNREKYCSILKSKYSEAHIYLLDKFQFDKFYVSPYLTTIESDLSRNLYIGNISGFEQPISYFQHSITIQSQHNNQQQELIKRREEQKIFDDYLKIDQSQKWKHIFDKNNIIYVIGGAGYGKTLFLQKIINDYKELCIYQANEYLVIYGELKSFYPKNSTIPLSVEQFLQNSMKACTLLNESIISIDLIRHYLDIGRCIILFDALDEVEKGKRENLHETLISFLKNQNPNNKICITSRDRGFIPEKDIEVFVIQPLNEDQIEKYVDNIISLGKFEMDSKDKFMKQTRILIEKGFLNSFLVLSLLVNIYKSENELPENKLELYQKCFEYIAKKREKNKTEDRYDWKIISPLMKDNTFMELSELCFPNNTPVNKSVIINRLLSMYIRKYNNEVDTENAIEDFLRFCSDRTELFVPAQGEDEFKFFHRSFFEYFYSQFIFVRFNDENEILEKLMQFDVDSEVFELTIAMLKQKSEEKYQKLIDLIFIKAIKELKTNDKQLNMFNILVLSMQAVDDVIYRNNFIQILIDYKDIICNNSAIQNNEIITDIVRSSKEYTRKICDIYYNDSMLFLLKLSLINNNPMLFFDIIHRKKTIEFLFSRFFYVAVYFENNDFHSVLSQLDEAKIDDIIGKTIQYNKLSNNKIKKIKKTIKKYQKDLLQSS